MKKTPAIDESASPITKALNAEVADLYEEVKTLCLRDWRSGGLEGYDGEVRRAINCVLEKIRAAGVIAWFPAHKVTLCNFTPRMHLGEETCKHLVTRLQELCTQQDTLLDVRPRREQLGDCWLYAINIPPIHKPSSGPVLSPSFRTNCCALVFEGAQGIADRTLSMENHALTVLPLFFQLMYQRVRLFAPFPGAISERYWNDALRVEKWERGNPSTLANRRDGQTRQYAPGSALRPAWDMKKESLRTATLSFDLRKSTFCMENADEPMLFAMWLDKLVQMLTQVSHHHGGIFDKFTGDGALIHFLEEDCAVVYGRSHMVAAVSCAADMRRVIGRHLEALRPLVRIWSELYGGAMGISDGEANWSIDHRGNPIVVGKGVVDACRLGDGIEAGVIRLSNISYERLLRHVGPELSMPEVHYESKDYDRSKRLKVRQLMELPRSWAGGMDMDELFDSVGLVPAH